MTIEKETLTIMYMYVFNKFCHHLFGNKFIFYVDHMVLLYLIQKPQVSRRIAISLLLFLENNFLIIYKLRRSHSMEDVLSRMFNLIEQSGVLDQKMDIIFSLLQLVLI
jgi:hypothetical protein